MAKRELPPVTKEKLHPVFTVSNIKEKVRFILDNQTVQYDHWAEFFRIQTDAYHVSSHLDSSPPSNLSSSDACQLKAIDSIILQWIYSTISDELVKSIFKPKQTAQEAWLKLQNLFRDNEGAPAAELEEEFISLRLSDCTSLDDYCTCLKDLADHLGAVGSPVLDVRRVQ